MAIVEETLEDMKKSHNWCDFFERINSTNWDKIEIHAIDNNVNTNTFNLNDIKEIIASAKGKTQRIIDIKITTDDLVDDLDWISIGRLKDKRYFLLIMEHHDVVDDEYIEGFAIVSNDLNRLIQSNLVCESKRRLGLLEGEKNE
jgi:hypothetical protein